jgi:metal-responsive CopG/Arc/MetJ family transcriptional regulator
MTIQTFNIALPNDLVRKVDQVAKREYRNRSELIREALRIYLEDKVEWQEIFKLGEKVMQTMGVKNENDVNKIVSRYRHGKKS